MEHTKAVKTQSNPDGPVFLFLSLYLLLLAFFILLNAIAETRDSRVQAAVASVKEAFLDKKPETQSFTDSAANPDVLIASDEFLETVKSVFSTAVNIKSFHENSDGTLLRVTIETSRIFEKGNAKLRQSIFPLLDGLAISLHTPAEGERRQVEVVLGTGESLPQGSQLGQNTEIRRAGVLARALRARGVPGNAMTVGIQVGDANLAQLTFFTREIENTQVTFEGLVREQ